MEWHSGSGYRAAPLAVPANGKTGFVVVPPAVTGINFTNFLAEERSLTNQIFLNGSGVAAGDIDGDGLCDLYFCGLDSPNVLYRNLGNWQFEDITAAAGVSCAGQASTGAALADLDGDGDLDLIVNSVGGGTRLFLNDGTGKFHEVTAASGLASAAGSMSFAIADIDGDGLLDVYVVNYRSDTMRDMPDLRYRVGITNGTSQILTVNGQPTSAPHLLGRFSIENNSSVLENGEASHLYHNLGAGRFEAISWTNGAFLDEHGAPVSTPFDWGLSAMFHDLNGDGAPDLYVCNDFQSPDRIWINDGHGHFKAIASHALQHTSLFSMGVDFADIDRDGFDDFFVADMLSREHIHRQVQVMDPRAFFQARHPATGRPQVSHNTLFHNRGNGTFAEIAELSGLNASDWSWCPVFLDVDLDGYEDLLVGTGHGRDFQNADVTRQIEIEKQQRKLTSLGQLHLRRQFSRLDSPNAAFRNRGDLTFEDVSAAWGFDSRRISHGIALADLDNDGDLDVIVNTLNDGPLLCRNDSTAPRLAVRLHGKTPNTRGVGARLRVSGPGLPSQSQEFHCGGRYLSSDDFQKAFAAGSTTNLLTVEVTWRNGNHNTITNVSANQILELDEAAGTMAPISPTAPIKPLFEDLSAMLKHEHKDEPYDDMARQPLLPRTLSNLGPGITWFDFNADGWDDLLIGAGRGGRLTAFRNDGKGHFIPQRSKLLELPAARDFTSILGWRPAADAVVLIEGFASYEESHANELIINTLSLATGVTHEDHMLTNVSAGPLAMADIDSDGDLDLFVGGRVIPGQYLQPASSAILRNENGQLHFDSDASHVFASIGMVSSALFTDLNADGWPDLALACEWAPIRIYKNEQGQFRAWDPPIRFSDALAAGATCTNLSQWTGRWNSIASGDFDGDGNLDLLVGNWGRNNFDQHFLNEPARLYYEKSMETTAGGLISAHYDPDLKKYVPTRDWSALSAVFPMLREKYPNFTALSAASVNDILDAGLPPMQYATAMTFDSVVLLNRTNYFEVRALPIEAQFAPVFGIAVGDLDGDGNEDIFLTQNFRGTGDADSPQDAGCSLVLLGDGHGNFSTLPPKASGIAIYGEGRGAALSDFDHDGRIDIAAGQNRGNTRLFRNVEAKPGLRVHLEGTSQNLQAAGASVRVIDHAGNAGPVHEVRMGGGYWSQDSSDIILGLKDEPQAIEIRWPGGKLDRVAIPAGSRDISKKHPGRPEGP